MSEIFIVSLGAILGANARFRIHTKFQNNNLRKEFSILVINTFASFCLGLFLSLMEQISYFIYSYQIVLFFSIGFLGSFSTFSSFVYDLFDFCLQFKFSRAIRLFIVSSSLGIAAFAFGFLLGNQ
tara:strand:- start:714 stop:1088 length:375 start_codon:yes stop_codon:yes gene_type:complete